MWVLSHFVSTSEGSDDGIMMVIIAILRYLSALSGLTVTLTLPSTLPRIQLEWKFMEMCCIVNYKVMMIMEIFPLRRNRLNCCLMLVCFGFGLCSLFAFLCAYCGMRPTYVTAKDN